MLNICARSIMLCLTLTTQAMSQGSMAPEVRVIRVSPSVSVYGSTQDIKKQRVYEAREAVKLSNQMQLEELKAYNKRLLEADKAYYKKLAEQRKARKK